MFFNYLKIALRSLRQQRAYSLINITGLALGITAFTLILQYMSLEQSVNRFHTRLPEMYMVMCQNTEGKSWPQVEPGWGKRFKDNFAEVSDVCRFENGIGAGIVQGEGSEQVFREEQIGYVDGNFFSMFSFPLLFGQAEALKKPDVAFISRTYAKKYFGTQEAIGKALILYNQFGRHRYIIEGIFKDMEENSDIRYDIVFSMETLNNKANLNGNTWAALDNLDAQFSNMMLTVQPKTDYKALEQKLSQYRSATQPEKDATRIRLQPFRETHLAADFSDDLYHTGNVRYVWMLAGIALLILLIAWFNYINLSTANTIRRANEVGVRKATGATKNNLMAQFLTETALVTTFALVLALLLVLILQPYFNNMIGKKLDLAVLFQSPVWCYGLITLFLGTLASGAYTALVLSGFNPVETLRGKISRTAKGLLLRQSLVVAQFGISMALILFTVLIFSQLKFMQHQNLGTNLAQLLVIRGPEVSIDSTYGARREAFWNDITAQSFVQDYCSSGCVPGESYNFATEGLTSPKSTPGDENKSFRFAIIGERFLGTYGIALKAGRNFTKEECATPWNQNSRIMVNETALNMLKLSPEEALTTRIRWDERELDIVGVVKDYHHNSLHAPIEPIIFYPQQNRAYLTLRIGTDQLPDKISTIKSVYQRHFYDNPFDYFFADANFQAAYESENRYSQLFTAASLWAIFIACLGLYGLVTFAVASKVKEIGVRKVLGASTWSVVALLTRDFMKLVLIAIFIALPVGWYLMQYWLSDFAYRIDIQWWMFALAAFSIALVAMLTIGVQSAKAAWANPVKSLRSE